jgi:hypothetical protein
LLLQFNNRLDTINFGCGEDHPIASLQGIEQETVLYFEIVGRAAGTKPL